VSEALVIARPPATNPMCTHLAGSEMTSHSHLLDRGLSPTLACRSQRDSAREVCVLATAQELLLFVCSAPWYS